MYAYACVLCEGRSRVRQKKEREREREWKKEKREKRMEKREGKEVSNRCPKLFTIIFLSLKSAFPFRTYSRLRPTSTIGLPSFFFLFLRPVFFSFFFFFSFHFDNVLYNDIKNKARSSRSIERAI